MPPARDRTPTREDEGYKAIIAAAAAGTLVGAGAAAGAPSPPSPGPSPPSTPNAAVAAAVAALSRKRGDTTWIADAIRPDFDPDDVSDLQLRAAAKLEREREAEFIRRLRARLERDIPKALAKPDPAGAVRKVLERERRFTEAHEEAAATRVQGIVRREQVRKLSPEGAYWRMSPLVKEHTPDCIALSIVGWWPWEVLDLLWPPMHPGCRCELLTFDEARAMGLMGAKVPDTSRSMERAQAIIDEYGLLQEAAVADGGRSMEGLSPSKTPANRRSLRDSFQPPSTNLHGGDPLLNTEEAAWLEPHERTPNPPERPAVSVENGDERQGMSHVWDRDVYRDYPANGDFPTVSGSVSGDGMSHGMGADIAEAVHTGAMVALYLPPELATELAIRGGEPPSELHMTLAFLGDTRDLGDPERTIEAVRAWAADLKPLEGEISGTGTFRAGPSPVTYLSVDLPELPSARERLVELLDDAGTPAATDHGFTPHITLDYASRRPKIDKGIPVTFDRVTLAWAGEHFSIPLGRGLTEAEHTELEEVVWNRRYAKGTVWGGRFMPRRGGFAPRISLGDVLRRLMGADAPRIAQRGGSPSPPVITTGPDGDLNRPRGAASPAVTAPEAPNLGRTREQPGVPFAGDSRGRPRDFTHLAKQVANTASELSDEYGRPLALRSIRVNPDGSDTEGWRDFDGHVTIGPEAATNLQRADEALSNGERLPDDHASGVYMAYRTMIHEAVHSVNPMDGETYMGDSAARALEEALTEEMAHDETIRMLQKAGHNDVLRWRARNPDDRRARGVYLPQRAGLGAILDEAEVPLEERRDLLRQLTFGAPPEMRTRILGARLAQAKGLSPEDGEARVRALMGSLDDRDVDPLGAGAEVLRHNNPVDYRMRIRPNARIKVTGRGADGDYDGTVLNAAYGEDGRWYAEVEVKLRDDNGQIVDTTIRYPDPDDVELLADAPRKGLKGDNITGPVAEGDLVRLKQNNGDILIGELRKVEAEDAFGWKAEVLTDDGEAVLVRQTSVRDVKRARPGAESIKRQRTEKVTPDGVMPEKPSDRFLRDAETKAAGKLEAPGDKKLVPHAIDNIVSMRREEGALDMERLASAVHDHSTSKKSYADLPNAQKEKRREVVRAALSAMGIAPPKPGPSEPEDVEGPRSFDPRRYGDPQRSLIRKVRALPRGETVDAADGSRITRGKRGDSVVIERPDGSRRRYPTANRMSQAEHKGIAVRVGMVGGTGQQLSPSEERELDDARKGQLSPAIVRKITDTLGIDPYDVDLDKLNEHAEVHRRKPRTRLREGSPCARKRDIDFAVHRLLPAMLQERYPNAARWLARTSPRWGESHYGEDGHLELPEPLNAQASPGEREDDRTALASLGIDSYTVPFGERKGETTYNVTERNAEGRITAGGAGPFRSREQAERWLEADAKEAPAEGLTDRSLDRGQASPGEDASEAIDAAIQEHVPDYLQGEEALEALPSRAYFADTDLRYLTDEDGQIVMRQLLGLGEDDPIPEGGVPNEHVPEGERVTVPIRELVPSQGALLTSNLRRWNDRAPAPGVAKRDHDGKLRMVDGHHRVAVQALRGNDEAEVIVLPGTLGPPKVSELGMASPGELRSRVPRLPPRIDDPDEHNPFSAAVDKVRAAYGEERALEGARELQRAWAQAEPDNPPTDREVRDYLYYNGIHHPALRELGQGRVLNDGQASPSEHAIQGMVDAVVGWQEARHRGPDPDRPDDETIAKNWRKQLRGRMSQDKEAITLVEQAQAENHTNPLWRRIVEAWVPDHVVVTSLPEDMDHFGRSMLDTGGVAERVQMLFTVFPDLNVHRIQGDAEEEGEDGEPAYSVKRGPQTVTSGWGVAAVLRHEYGHSLDGALDPAVRQEIVEMIPDPKTELTYYSGKGDDSIEVIPELLTVVTDPDYDPDDWPESVQRAGRRLLEAILPDPSPRELLADGEPVDGMASPGEDALRAAAEKEGLTDVWIAGSADGLTRPVAVGENEDGEITVLDEEDGWVERAADWLGQADPEDWLTNVPDTNADFWSNGPDEVYHATDPENVEAILRDGLLASNRTRGMSNRGTGAAVFTSTNPSTLEHYGEGRLKIDVAAMRRDGLQPTVSREEPLEEADLKAALMYALGIDDLPDYSPYDGTIDDGLDPDTYIFHDDIPAKYVGQASPGEWSTARESGEATKAERTLERMASPAEGPHTEGTRTYKVPGAAVARMQEGMARSDYGDVLDAIEASTVKKVGSGSQHHVELTPEAARDMVSYLDGVLAAEDSMGAGEAEPGLKAMLKRTVPRLRAQREGTTPPKAPSKPKAPLKRGERFKHNGTRYFFRRIDGDRVIAREYVQGEPGKWDTDVGPVSEVFPEGQASPGASNTVSPAGYVMRDDPEADAIHLYRWLYHATPEERAKLAEGGRMAPHRTEREDLAATLRGEKPATLLLGNPDRLLREHEDQLADSDGFAIEVDREMDSIIVAPEGDWQKFGHAGRMLQRAAYLGPRSAYRNIKQGVALGYSATDIARFFVRDDLGPDFFDWEDSRALIDYFPKPTSPERVGMASPPIPGQGKLTEMLKGKPERTPEVERSELEAPPAPVQGIPTYDGEQLTDVKAAGGSNGARFAEDADGRRWLVKTYKGDRDRVATELLANAIYRELGVRVPNAGQTTVKVPKHGPTQALTYPLVDGEERRWDDANPDLAEGFVADALLANWDVVGLTQDNVLWNGDTPIRLDQGGTLEFRAMGSRKPFGPVPTELWTMNKPGGQAFGRMAITDDSLRAQAKDAELRLTDERIDALVDATPFADEDMRERVRQALKDRVAWLGRYSRGEEAMPEPLNGEDTATEFEARDAALETFPEEDAALEHYLDPEGQADVDAHLRSGNPKDAAPTEVQGTVQQLDALLGDKLTKVGEDFYGYLTVPSIDALGPDASKLHGKWLRERSYLSIANDLDDTPGVVVRITVPEGSNALMPAAVDGIVDPTPGRILLPRGSRLQLGQVRELDGRTVIDAVASTR